MARIANPIQQAQGLARHESVQDVIFNHNSFASRAHGLVEQLHRLLRMMQYIDKHHGIKRRIIIGDHLAVEGFDRDMGLASDEDIEASQSQVGAPLHELPGEQAIAAADVQHLGIPGQEFAEVVAQHPHPASMDIGSMESYNQAHLRRIPRMLMKKLESTV
jgi:hypothetical protein